MVDVANVMGARPDGWWRDRAGAAERLGREIAALAARGDGPAGRWVLVLEGRAREAAGRLDGVSPLLRVALASGSGDDEIVAVAAAAVARGESCVVVTADRELRRRCETAGARVAGPRWLTNLL